MRGLEVPVMVLQTKIFLITLLLNYTPFSCRRKTFMQKVQHAVGNTFRHSISKNDIVGTHVEPDIELGQHVSKSTSINSAILSAIPQSEDFQASSTEMTTETNHQHESRILRCLPFPELRHAIYVRPRDEKD